MSGKPLVPGDLKSRRAIPRAAFALITARVLGGNAERHLIRMFPDDYRAALSILQRAAETGGTTTVAGWAAELVGTAVADWLPSLYPLSAAAQIIARGMLLTFDGNGTIKVPGRATAPTAAPSVAEGGPIPARSYTLASAVLSPRKTGAIVAWSRELARLATSGEIVFRALLEEDFALSLDTAYFSAGAGSASDHAGLLNGVTATPPSSGVPASDMQRDLVALAEAVSPASSDALIFVCAPGRAAAINLNETIEATVLPSIAVPAARVIALDASALVHGFSGVPDFLASSEATVVMSDTPTDIGVVGSPTVVAAPTQSLFQTAQVAMRMLVDCAFAKRRPGCVAYLDATDW
jgi:hypothetical protein